MDIQDTKGEIVELRASCDKCSYILEYRTSNYLNKTTAVVEIAKGRSPFCRIVVTPDKDKARVAFRDLCKKLDRFNLFKLLRFLDNNDHVLRYSLFGAELAE